MKSKIVENYPCYLIYEDGKIYSNKTNKFLKHNAQKDGYYTVKLYGERTKTIKVHRLVAEHFVSGDKALSINHIDGDKSNNHKLNLEFITHTENIRHSYRIGLRKNLSHCSDNARKAFKARMKFDDIQIEKIKQLHKDGVGFRQIGREFDVAHTTIMSICKNKSYKDANRVD